MELISLIYCSTATKRCDQKAIDDILYMSQRLNSRDGISGILYFSKSYFMQYLEGYPSHIEDTYSRILKDYRHSSLEIIMKEPTQAREFSGWSMAFVPHTEHLTPLNKKYMNNSEFKPYGISSSVALEIVRELKSQLPKAHYADGTEHSDENE